MPLENARFIGIFEVEVGENRAEPYRAATARVEIAADVRRQLSQRPLACPQETIIDIRSPLPNLPWFSGCDSNGKRSHPTCSDSGTPLGRPRRDRVGVELPIQKQPDALPQIAG